MVRGGGGGVGPKPFSANRSKGGGVLMIRDFMRTVFRTPIHLMSHVQ